MSTLLKSISIADNSQEDKVFTVKKGVEVFTFVNLKLYVGLEQVGDKSIKLLRFEGSINNQSDYKLNRKIHNLLLEVDTDLIIDLKHLEYTNSVGMAIFFSIFHRQKENDKQVLLVGMNSFLREVFELVYLPPEVLVVENVELAKKHLKEITKNLKS